MGRNIIHGSDSPEAAAHEIKMWFTDDQVFNYKRAVDTWNYEN
jgi:nucleoside-diphosphate kinase